MYHAMSSGGSAGAPPPRYSPYTPAQRAALAKQVRVGGSLRAACLASTRRPIWIIPTLCIVVNGLLQLVCWPRLT
jgi:hypothetical protein